MTENCIIVKILFSNNTFPFGLRKYLNSTRYVAIEQLKLDNSVQVTDLEIGSIQDIEFVYRKGTYLFKCEILNNEIEVINPGEILKQSETSLKREISITNISGSANKKKPGTSVDVESNSDQSVSLSNTLESNNSQVNSGQTAILENEMQFERNVSVNKMYSLAIQNIFPKKKIIVKEEESFYTPILIFLTLMINL